MRIIAFISYFISVIFIGLGFYKMFVYKNPESYVLDSVNAYVGGDAYNYIINAGYATAYFILALVFVVLGCFLFMYELINRGYKVEYEELKDPEVLVKISSFKEENQ